MLTLAVIGNLGNDPEMKYSASGSPVLRFNIAANFRVRNESGEWGDKTEWVRVTVFGQRADSLSTLLKKGQRVYADGRLEARPWTTNNGELRAGLEMIADTVEFASSRRDDEQGRGPIPQMGKSDADDSDLPF